MDVTDPKNHLFGARPRAQMQGELRSSVSLRMPQTPETVRWRGFGPAFFCSKVGNMQSCRQ